MRDVDYRPHGPETQRAAAVGRRDRKVTDQDRARRALELVGPYGATDFELAELTGVGQTSIGKRRLELERAGIVARRLSWGTLGSVLVADRRPAPSGALAAVWVLAEWAEPAGRDEQWAAS